MIFRIHKKIPICLKSRLLSVFKCLFLLLNLSLFIAGIDAYFLSRDHFVCTDHERIMNRNSEWVFDVLQIFRILKIVFFNFFKGGLHRQPGILNFLEIHLVFKIDFLALRVVYVTYCMLYFENYFCDPLQLQPKLVY